MHFGPASIKDVYPGKGMKTRFISPLALLIFIAELIAQTGTWRGRGRRRLSYVWQDCFRRPNRGRALEHADIAALSGAILAEDNRQFTVELNPLSWSKRVYVFDLIKCG